MKFRNVLSCILLGFAAILTAGMMYSHMPPRWSTVFMGLTSGFLAAQMIYGRRS